MVVFHIISHFDVGGAERVALNIAKSATKNISYHIVEVARSNSNFSQSMIDETLRAGVMIHRSSISNTKVAIMRFPQRLKKLIKEFKPTIIHTHTEVPDLAIYLTSLTFKKVLKNKIIVRTIHNNQLWSKWGSIGYLVEKFLQSKATIIAISQSTQASYLNRYGFMPPIIYNGVAKPENKQFFGLVPGKINILFCGRMEYQKGCDVMVNVVSLFANDNRFQFHIAGNGNESKQVKECIGKYNNVSLYDSIPNLSSYIGSFDCLFMPSLFEGLALTPIEAAMAQTPTIINDAPGLSEIFPKDWPLKVKDNNIDTYYNYIEGLSVDECQRLGREISNYVASRFSIDKMQYSYEKIYNENSRKKSLS